MAAQYPPNTQYQPFQPAGSPQVSSRQLYPTFISIQESLSLQLKWVWLGLYDAFRWTVVVSTISGDAEIRANVYKSLLLNSLSIVSIYTFDLLLLPLVKDQQRWFHRNIGLFYQVLWLMPVVGISFYLNSSWCSIVAKRAYILQYGTRATHQQPTTYNGLLTAIATSAYRGVMAFNSVVVSFGLYHIPYIGRVAGFVFFCWVDAYYCFEFVWIARGMSLPRRIRHLEERWAYYFAFGLPPTALCMCGTGLANLAIFALVFPLYVILAMVARPVPSDPYTPLPPATRADGSEVIRHPSPFIPIRLPIFAPVIWLNDTVVKVLSIGPRRIPGHGRTLSDTTDAVEEGASAELREVRQPPMRPTRDRVNIGRRKVD